MSRYEYADKEKLSEKIKSAVVEAVDKDKGLFILGGTGTGKTYAMHVLAKNKGKVENFSMLLAELRDTMQRGYYFEQIKTFVNQEYMFIDDIGAEKTSDFVLEVLYLIINGRYENMKKTVLSSNMDLDKFSERYGDRILSRIAELCVVVKLEGDDKRISAEETL